MEAIDLDHWVFFLIIQRLIPQICGDSFTDLICLAHSLTRDKRRGKKKGWREGRGGNSREPESNVGKTRWRGGNSSEYVGQTRLRGGNSIMLIHSYPRFPDRTQVLISWLCWLEEKLKKTLTRNGHDALPTPSYIVFLLTYRLLTKYTPYSSHPLGSYLPTHPI